MECARERLRLHRSARNHGSAGTQMQASTELEFRLKRKETRAGSLAARIYMWVRRACVGGTSNCCAVNGVGYYTGAFG